MNEWDRQIFIVETGIDPVGEGSEAVSHCEWRPIEEESPKDMEIVAFWVENKMQPVPGRAYFGRYLGVGRYDLGRDMDHYIKNGKMVVTHWRRLLGPDGQSPEGR